MSQRIQKINDLIRDNLSMIITRELSMKPEVFVSIMKVDTSKDLRYTRVLVSIYPNGEKKYVLKTFKKELYRLQKALNQSLEIKNSPKIHFVADETQEKVVELENVFDKIKQEDGC